MQTICVNRILRRSVTFAQRIGFGRFEKKIRKDRQLHSAQSTFRACQVVMTWKCAFMSVWATNNHTSQLVFNKLRTFSVKLKKQNVKSIAYLYLNKLGVRKVSSFPFPDFFVPFTDFYERRFHYCARQWLFFYVFLWNWLVDGKIDSLAHGQRLNAFLGVARPRFQTRFNGRRTLGWKLLYVCAILCRMGFTEQDQKKKCNYVTFKLP